MSSLMCAFKTALSHIDLKTSNKEFPYKEKLLIITKKPLSVILLFNF